ncbi:class I SAM-dependent methyltransferase [Luteibacter yeojuensis]|uniref:Methyltransferase domain-containing protein n=1 Tax=Luteibacter yeojuensis TaxID=345309 RepID=A0A7X5QSS4_9GAMM|nr:methyltransferase domain-containing protein [Luteibacter yeojuensis]NID14755.1 methyltransferase domain-containing protein [Luteibacter yeojuensis]
MNHPASSTGLLGDTAARDYAAKLRRFNAFAAPEIRESIARLGFAPGMRVLDAGCGTGEALGWLSEAVGPDGAVAGIDLATAHVASARDSAPGDALVIQGDLTALPFVQRSFDLVWSVNTFNHLHDPVACIRRVASLLRAGGRVALGQSSLLPDMYFAWDSRLERLTNDAVRQYYRDRYGLDERDLAAVRSLVGMLRDAGLRNVTARTVTIERVSPVSPDDERYLVETLFRDSWGERLRPYLSPDDYEALGRLCDPADAGFALRRPDFHFLQTFTVAVGGISA